MTRRILAVDSATDWLSLAFLEGDEVVCARDTDARMQHASALLPGIDEVLGEVGAGLDDLDGIVLSTGPGSFTSLRIGIATIKGLAFRRDLQTVGVSTLEAMALAGLEGDPGVSEEASVLALLDARRGEWYAGSWRRGESPGALPIAVLPEGLYNPEALAERISDPVQVRAPQAGSWEPYFEPGGRASTRIVRGEEARPQATWVGRLGQRRLAAGEGIPAEALVARYVRRAEAEAKRLGGPVEAGEVARIGDSTGGE